MKWIKYGLPLLVLLYIIVCIILYFVQVNLLFNPTKLSKGYQYPFDENFEEVNLTTADNTSLHSVLFKSVESKGVVLFLHGNGGTIDQWGTGANLYIENGYDVLYLDYRSYGKSEGRILSESQLMEDAQLVYDFLKNKYSEERIILSGTSMGSGMATQLAAKNKPKQLILISPYSSLEDLILEKVPIIPRFIIKFKLNTKQHIEKVGCPITIFHGNSDELIPHAHALKLKEVKPDIDLHIVDRCGHNNVPISRVYQKEMGRIFR